MTVQWKGVGPLASKYIVEVRESATSASNLFTRMAPQDATESLELCIQGLEAGRSYVACVRSVTQDGAESSSSPWSSWLNLPFMAPQQFEFAPPSVNVSTPYIPSLTLREMYEVPLQQPEKQVQVGAIQGKQVQVGAIQAKQLIPEITTGQDELMLFLD